MEEKIEQLREELKRLTEDNICLYSHKVVELSQKLNELIYKYYQNSIVA